VAKELTKDPLKSKRPATKTVPVCMDPDLAWEWADANREAERLRMASSFQADDVDLSRRMQEAETKVEALRPAVEDATVNFVLKAIGREDYALYAKYPATDEQKAKAREQGVRASWNEDDFPPALVAASLVLPDDSDVTVEDVIGMFSDPDWSQGEVLELLTAALDLNTRNSVVDLGKDFGTTAG
jgi:hypothetical protein